MTKQIWAVALGLALTACQQAYFKDETAFYSQLPEGSKIILHKPLKIFPGRAGVQIQDGHSEREGGIDLWEPHCRFELLTVEETTQVIEPDVFVVDGVRIEWELISGEPAIQLASAGGGDGGDGGGISIDNRKTAMFLAPTVRNPNIYRLICGQWKDAWDMDGVSIAELRQVGGEIFSVELPPAAQASDGGQRSGSAGP